MLSTIQQPVSSSRSEHPLWLTWLTEDWVFGLEGVAGLGVDAWRPALKRGRAEGVCELDMISWPPDVRQDELAASAPLVAVLPTD